MRRRFWDPSSAARVLAFVRRRWLPLALALAVIVPTFLVVRYLRSAGRVANAAVAALNRGDVDALLRLSARKERDLLGLTRESVEAYLRQTWYSGGKSRSLQIVWEAPFYQDVIVFTTICKTRGSREKPRQHQFVVYQNPEGRWRLVLSRMLSGLVSASGLVPEGQDPNRRWMAIARSSGIRGTIYIEDNHAVRWSATGVNDPRPFYLTRQP